MTEENTSNPAESPKHPEDMLFARLQAQWPVLFDKKNFVPLKLGIFHDILAASPDIDPRALKAVLGRWCGNVRYQQKLTANAPRTGLDGPNGEVSEAEALHASEKVTATVERAKAKHARIKAHKAAMRAAQKTKEAKPAEQEAKAAQPASQTAATTEQPKPATEPQPPKHAPASPVITVKKRRSIPG
jgi:sRNA-binding protein